jgi:hypothetical protein
MNKRAFAELDDKIKPYFPDKKHARPDTVSSTIALSMTLRWLAGGSYVFIYDLHIILSKFCNSLWSQAS